MERNNKMGEEETMKECKTAMKVGFALALLFAMSSLFLYFVVSFSTSVGLILVLCALCWLFSPELMLSYLTCQKSLLLFVSLVLFSFSPSFLCPLKVSFILLGGHIFLLYRCNVMLYIIWQMASNIPCNTLRDNLYIL